MMDVGTQGAARPCTAENYVFDFMIEKARHDSPDLSRAIDLSTHDMPNFGLF